MSEGRIKGRLIVALDLPDVAAAETVVEAVGDATDIFKIGYQLAPVGGFELARTLRATGRRVFLDLKYHDIGATVEKGVRSVRAVGADFLTVHPEPEVLRAAVAGREDDPRLKILAVTVLTSIAATDVESLVLARAEAAAEAGVDGVIASPREAAAVKARFGDRLLVVTPGVRPAGAPVDDQARVATPAEAIGAGADYLVVGRPVTAAADPRAAARAIAAEIAAAGPPAG